MGENIGCAKRHSRRGQIVNYRPGILNVTAVIAAAKRASGDSYSRKAFETAMPDQDPPKDSE